MQPLLPSLPPYSSDLISKQSKRRNDNTSEVKIVYYDSRYYYRSPNTEEINKKRRKCRICVTSLDGEVDHVGLNCGVCEKKFNKP